MRKLRHLLKSLRWLLLAPVQSAEYGCGFVHSPATAKETSISNGSSSELAGPDSLREERSNA
jgi:hypothetical protein